MKKSFLITAIVCTVTFFSCSNKELSNVEKTGFRGEDLFSAIYFAAGPAAKSLKSYSVFSDKIAEMEKTDKEFVKRENAFFTEINAEIAKIDPNFFSNFKGSVESNNYYSIEVALKNGGQTLLKALNNIPKYKEAIDKAKVLVANAQLASSSQRINMKDPNSVRLFQEKSKDMYMTEYYDESEQVAACTPGLAVCVAVAAVVWEVGVAVNVGVAVTMGAAVYVAVIYKTKFLVSSVQAEDADLSDEAMVAEIAESFNAAA